MTSLTLFFIVEPRTYQYFLACFLGRDGAALPPFDPDIPDRRLLPRTPDGRTRPVCRRGVGTDGLRGAADADQGGLRSALFPHGNKLAVLPRAPRHGLGRVPGQRHRLCSRPHGHQGRCSWAAYGPTSPARSRQSIGWAPPDLWDGGLFWRGGVLPVPEERVRLSRNQQQSVPPDFRLRHRPVSRNPNARTNGARGFAELWMDTAQIVDRCPH